MVIRTYIEASMVLMVKPFDIFLVISTYLRGDVTFTDNRGIEFGNEGGHAVYLGKLFFRDAGSFLGLTVGDLRHDP